ncbi:MAG TPA: glycosyltransferase family 87 protein [Puia sp.]|nr:glycosyltransferase family 87 protein [Puia sp.]
MQSRNKVFLSYIPLVLLLGACLIHSVSVPWSDFAGYYFGGKQLLHGDYKSAYDTNLLNGLIEAQGYKGLIVSYTPFPPFTSLLFAPFDAFPMGTAKLLFNCCCCALFLFTLSRSRKFFSIPLYIVWLAPVLFFIPLVNNIFFGQAYLLLVSLLLEGYMAYKREKIVLSSFLWATAILFKLFPVVIFLFLLLRKKYRNGMYLAAACFLLLIPSLWLNGVPSWKFYLLEIAPRLNKGELNDSFTFMFQSAFMLLKNIFIDDGLLNPHPAFANPYLFVIMIALFKGLIISCCVMLTIRKKENDLLSFSTWLAASMLVSPNGSSYSLILLLAPLLALTTDPVGEPARKRSSVIPWAIVLLILACNIPVNRFAAAPVWAQYPRLYLLLAFFGLLLMRQEKLFNGKLFALISALLIALDIPNYIPRKDASSYFLAREEHGLIYDFAVKENKLVYYYRDGSGTRETATDYAVSSFTGEGLLVQDNQIWYRGKKLTASPDWKRKAMLVNGEYILYLSDKHRGVGFFTLRKLRSDGAITDIQEGTATSR